MLVDNECQDWQLVVLGGGGILTRERVDHT